MKSKKIILITSIIIFILIILSLIIGIIVASNNASIKKQGVDIVIYQYHVANFHFDTTQERKEIFRAKFSDELTYDEIIYALDNSASYNHVIIKDGKAYIEDANCRGHNCQRTTLLATTDSLSLLDNLLDISCYPNGLFIVLEERKNEN